ncbi:glycosyltransferase family 39 protein [Haloferax sp. ATB1]|uniref:ArnT family glycosyltransferase n=1 Tax=Haloferax sp. ATB1 TaxID=1508454 RepID=UPI0005B1E66F|nr:glycosyltransferase family 39 protein [Haloferax sp. ATB1]
MSDVISRLKTKPRLVLVAVVVSFVFLRTILATQSAYNFHHGWNEGHYALIARGFLSHPVVPRYGESYIYNVPPLYPYLISVFFLVVRESALVARFTSILAAAGTVVATYFLGIEVFRRKLLALGGALGLTLLPFFQLYAGRAQTDMTMLLLFTLSITSIVRGYERNLNRWLVVGGTTFAAAFAAKQPAILIPPILLLWALVRGDSHRRIVTNGAIVATVAIIALLPLAWWFWVNYTLEPQVFVSTWEDELFGRTVPFANLPLLVAIAGLLGFTPPVLFLAGTQLVDTVKRVGFSPRRLALALDRSGILWSWIFIYGAFVLYRTPRSHQYYAVALAPPIALLAFRGLEIVWNQLSEDDGTLHIAIVVILVIGVFSGAIVLFELSGEYSVVNGGGDTNAKEVATYLEANGADGATILVMNEYRPPVQWYLRDTVPVDSVQSYHVSSLSESALTSAVENSSSTVYVVYPDPTWDEFPREDATPVYRTDSYEYSVVSLIDSVVDTDSKLNYYLEHRQLVVYRLDR